MPGAEVLQELLEGLEDPGGAGDGEAGVRALSGAAAGQGARFPGDEVARPVVPGVQAPLVVAVQAACGQVAQVDRRRAAAADVAEQGISFPATSAWWVRTFVT